MQRQQPLEDSSLSNEESINKNPTSKPTSKQWWLTDDIAAAEQYLNKLRETTLTETNQLKKLEFLIFLIVRTSTAKKIVGYLLEQYPKLLHAHQEVNQENQTLLNYLITEKKVELLQIYLNCLETISIAEQIQIIDEKPINRSIINELETKITASPISPIRIPGNPSDIIEISFDMPAGDIAKEIGINKLLTDYQRKLNSNIRKTVYSLQQARSAANFSLNAYTSTEDTEEKATFHILERGISFYKKLFDQLEDPLEIEDYQTLFNLYHQYLSHFLEITKTMRTKEIYLSLTNHVNQYSYLIEKYKIKKLNTATTAVEKAKIEQDAFFRKSFLLDLYLIISDTFNERINKAITHIDKKALLTSTPSPFPAISLSRENIYVIYDQLDNQEGHYFHFSCTPTLTIILFENPNKKATISFESLNKFIPHINANQNIKHFIFNNNILLGETARKNIANYPSLDNINQITLQHDITATNQQDLFNLLNKMPNLSQLNISTSLSKKNNFINALLRLATIKNINKLCIHTKTFTDKMLSKKNGALETLKNIHILDLANTAITDNSISTLASLAAKFIFLEKIDISNTNITLAGAKKLVNEMNQVMLATHKTVPCQVIFSGTELIVTPEPTLPLPTSNAGQAHVTPKNTRHRRQLTTQEKTAKKERLERKLKKQSEIDQRKIAERTQQQQLNIDRLKSAKKQEEKLKNERKENQKKCAAEIESANNRARQRTYESHHLIGFDIDMVEEEDITATNTIINATNAVSTDNNVEHIKAINHIEENNLKTNTPIGTDKNEIETKTTHAENAIDQAHNEKLNAEEEKKISRILLTAPHRDFKKWTADSITFHASNESNEPIPPHPLVNTLDFYLQTMSPFLAGLTNNNAIEKELIPEALLGLIWNCLQLLHLEEDNKDPLATLKKYILFSEETLQIYYDHFFNIAREKNIDILRTQLIQLREITNKNREPNKIVTLRIPTLTLSAQQQSPTERQLLKKMQATLDKIIVYKKKYAHSLEINPLTTNTFIPFIQEQKDALIYFALQFLIHEMMNYYSQLNQQSQCLIPALDACIALNVQKNTNQSYGNLKYLDLETIISIMAECESILKIVKEKIKEKTNEVQRNKPHSSSQISSDDFYSSEETQGAQLRLFQQAQRRCSQHDAPNMNMNNISNANSHHHLRNKTRQESDNPLEQHILRKNNK